MAIYEYSCLNCGNFEISQSIKDEPLKVCPKCSSECKRLISSTSFHLRGTGWYKTDYNKSDRETKNAKDKDK